MRRFSITVSVPWTLWGVRCLLAALTVLNRGMMRHWKSKGRKVPRLYKAGVRYIRQPPEHFRMFDEVLQRGGGDCDHLASYRAAELQEQGEDAKAIPQKSSVGMHVVVRRGDGTIEDPSKRLGMGRESGRLWKREG